LFGADGGPRAHWVTFVDFHGSISFTKLGANKPTTAQTRRVCRAWPVACGVGRKPNAKARDDEQEPDMRCGTLGTSGHVTARSPPSTMGYAL